MNIGDHLVPVPAGSVAARFSIWCEACGKREDYEVVQMQGWKIVETPFTYHCDKCEAGVVNGKTFTKGGGK